MNTTIRAPANSAACGGFAAAICTPSRVPACRRKASIFRPTIRRTPESNDARVAWAFEGITYDEKLGNFGLVGGGAAGTELDIVDTMLGSPPHTLVVATSAGRHTEGYLLVMEDYGFNQQGLDGTQHPRVRVPTSPIMRRRTAAPPLRSRRSRSAARCPGTTATTISRNWSATSSIASCRTGRCRRHRRRRSCIAVEPITTSR